MAKLLKDTCSIAAQILEGEFDDVLHYIEQAAKARQKRLAPRVGQMVEATDSCPDKNLEGILGRCSKITSRNVQVDIDLDFKGRYMSIPLEWFALGYVKAI